METVTATPQRRERAERAWRVRAGIGKTFGPLFLMLSVLLILIGVMELYNAWAEPLTADGGQVILGSVSLAIALLLIGFLWRQSR